MILIFFFESRYSLAWCVALPLKAHTKTAVAESVLSKWCSYGIGSAVVVVLKNSKAVVVMVAYFRGKFDFYPGVRRGYILCKIR